MYFWFTEPSSPPEEVRGSAQSSTSINIQWDPPLPEHQNGEIDSYIVLCTGTGGTMSRHTTSNTQITIDDLHPYYTYSCNVSAVTVAMGPFTHTIDVKTLEDGTFSLSLYFSLSQFITHVMFLLLFLSSFSSTI